MSIKRVATIIIISLLIVSMCAPVCAADMPEEVLHNISSQVDLEQCENEQTLSPLEPCIENELNPETNSGITADANIDENLEEQLLTAGADIAVNCDEWSLTLDEGISANLYFQCNAEVSLYATVDDAMYELIKDRQDSSKYVLKMNIPPKRLGDRFEVKVFSSDAGSNVILKKNGERVDSINVCIRDYISSACQNNNSEQLRNLLSAVGDYSKAAQQYFEYNNPSTFYGFADDTLFDEYEKKTYGTMPEGISYMGSSLVLGDKISIRHYFDIESGHTAGEYNVSYGGKNYLLDYESSKNLYRITTAPLLASNYSKLYTLNVSKDYNNWVMIYGPYSYCKGAMQDDNYKLKELCKTIGYYAECHKAYFTGAVCEHGAKNTMYVTGQNGLIPIVTCVLCGEYISTDDTPSEPVDPGQHTHEFDTEIIKYATCNEKGQKKIFCRNCDYVSIEELDKKEHIYVERIVARESTCLAEGKIEIRCVCGDYKTEKIPRKTEHDYEMVTHIVPDYPCAGSEYKMYKCKSCGCTESEETFPLPPHTFITVTVTEATYEHDGLIREECSACGKVKEGSQTVIPKLENAECTHPSHRLVKTSPATCLSYAQYDKMCETCGAFIGTTRGTKRGDHGELVQRIAKKATFLDEGEMEYRCNLCGAIVRKEVIPKLEVCPHDGYVYYEDFHDGTRGVYCTFCDILLRIEYTDSPISSMCRHTKTKQVMNTAPTATTMGIVDIICLDCGKHMGTETIHAYSEYTVDLGDGKTTTVYGYFDDAKARECYILLNEYRASLKLGTLEWAEMIDTETRTRAVEAAYSFEHTRPNRQKFWQLQPKYMNRENLAAGFLSARDVMEGWKSSEGHNFNMCAEGMRSVNIACFKRMDFGDDPNRLTPIGEIYVWVQVFSQFEK